MLLLFFLKKASKKASESAFLTAVQGEMDCRNPPAHQWVHVGAVLQGFQVPWFSCLPDKPKLGRPSTVSVGRVDDSAEILQSVISLVHRHFQELWDVKMK